MVGSTSGASFVCGFLLPYSFSPSLPHLVPRRQGAPTGELSRWVGRGGTIVRKRRARAHVQMHPASDLWKPLIQWVASHTPSSNAIRLAVCEIWKTGVHVRTCRCIPPLTCVKLLSNGPRPQTKFERNSPSRLRNLEKGCARAHAQMHSTSDMCSALI